MKRRRFLAAAAGGLGLTAIAITEGDPNMTEHRFPEDAGTGAHPSGSGDKNDAASFAQAYDAIGLTDHAKELSFDPDFTVPEVTIDMEKAVVTDDSATSTQTGETRDGVAYVQEMDLQTRSLTDDTTNYIYLDLDLSSDNKASYHIDTDQTPPSSPYLYLGVIDTANETYSRENAKPSETFESVSTEEINNSRHIRPGSNISEINDELSTPGTVVFDPGTHTVTDRVEPTANNLRVVVEEGATVRFADSASPTTVTSKQGGDRTFLFYVVGVTGFALELRGELDPNNANQTRGIGVFYDSVTNGYFNQNNGRFTDCHAGAVFADCKELVIPNIWCDGITSGTRTATVAMEGCENVSVDSAGVVGPFEVMDLNGANSGVSVDKVWANGGNELVEIDQSVEVVINQIRNYGSVSDTRIITIGSSINTHYSDKTLGETRDIDINGVYGTATEEAIKITPEPSTNPLNDISITGINVTSQANYGILTNQNTANQLDGLHLEGKVVNESTTSGDHGWLHKTAGGKTEGVYVDLDVTSQNNVGAVTQNVHDLTGTIKATDCGDYGVIITGSDGGTVNGVSLEVITKRNANQGTRVDAGDNVQLTGVSEGNTGDDVNINGGEKVRVDMDFGTFNPGGVRTLVNGVGKNAGDPNSSGEWNGYGEEGVVVVDTSNSTTYHYRGGGWV
jgi:hypothetical protein